MQMNQSIYKTDYVSYNWMENNFDSNSEEFCSSENIDDCLRYISQEFSALGYPSIYSCGNTSPDAENCDIVQLLNVTFDLISSNREHAQIKEELDTRNQRLFSDLAAANKKNAQLKEGLEQSERKYRSSFERERQLKEKNHQLLQQIKSEKEETKKLTSQIQQQKVAYQHEARKYENSMNQMKSRLNQLLADKNPDKKISVSPSSLLQRNNSYQRGKWKTGSVAKSSLEEMYSSLISTYENQCQNMSKKVTEFHGCFEFIQSQLLETVSVLEGDSGNSPSCEAQVPLQAILNGPDAQKGLRETFWYLLSKVKEAAVKQPNRSGKEQDEMAFLRSQAAHYERVLESQANQEEVNENNANELEQKGNMATKSSESNVLKVQLEIEKEKLRKERMELAAVISHIEKEKSNLAVQKLEMIKMQQLDLPRSQWHQNLNTSPSFSVITSKNGSVAVPCSSQLRSCLSSPHQESELTPLWKTFSLKDLPKQKAISEPSQHLSPSTSQYNIASPEPDISSLPKWAAAAIIASPEEMPAAPVTIISNTVSNEDLDVTVKMSEEQNLTLLHAAMKDIDDRRKKFSAT